MFIATNAPGRPRAARALSPAFWTFSSIVSFRLSPTFGSTREIWLPVGLPKLSTGTLTSPF